MVIEPVFGVFDSGGRCHILLEYKICSISIKVLVRKQQEVLLNVLVDDCGLQPQSTPCGAFLIKCTILGNLHKAVIISVACVHFAITFFSIQPTFYAYAWSQHSLK